MIFGLYDASAVECKLFLLHFLQMKKRRPERTEQYESLMYKTLLQRLSDALIRLRAQKGWTQEQAAAECDMSPRLYQRCETGDSNLTLTTLARICTGFQTDPADLWKPDDAD